MFRPTAFRLALILSLPVLAAGCATASDPAQGPAAPAVAQVGGSWVGSVTVEGQAIDGTLELTQDGAALQAQFSAPAFGLSAAGAGRVLAEGKVEIRLDYNMQCPGAADMDGTLSSDGKLLSGVLRATDCTGQMVGAFDFRRVDPGTR